MDRMTIANKSRCVQRASIWTEDLENAEKLSRSVTSRIVTVNNVLISDPRLRFEVVISSGLGGELSRYGMLDFVNIKSIRFYDKLVRRSHSNDKENRFEIKYEKYEYEPKR